MAQGTIKVSAKGKTTKAVHSKRQASKVTKSGGGGGGKGKSGGGGGVMGTTTKKAMKKFTSGLTAKTEAMLGERAGHLELIGKGRRDKGKKATQKGGSKKFG